MVKEDLIGKSIICENETEYREIIDLLFELKIPSYKNRSKEYRYNTWGEYNGFEISSSYFSGSVLKYHNSYLKASELLSTFNNKENIYELW